MSSAHALRHQFEVSSGPSGGLVPLLVDSTSLEEKTAGDVAFSSESSNRKPAELRTQDRHWQSAANGRRSVPLLGFTGRPMGILGEEESFGPDVERGGAQ